MKKAHGTLMLLALALSLGATLNAASHVAKLRYFATDPGTVIAMLPPPPAEDSIIGMADIETLLQIQKNRTPAQVALAKTFEPHIPLTMGTRVFGPKFTKKNLPRTFAFINKTTNECVSITVLAKERWNRVRPFDRNLGIKPCVALHSLGSSYPSGHSAVGALREFFFSEAMPEYKTLFAEVRRDIMWSRVVAGVHYPTDTQAGCQLGHLIAREMLKNRATLDAIAEMRAEILAFLKKNPLAAPTASPSRQNH